ncbi:MAG: GNAT family N-acetyltransferase [Pseudomonadota bacterium]
MRVASEDPDSADARLLMAELSATLAAITGDAGLSSFDPRDARGPGATFLVARDAHGTAMGCVALRPLGGATCANAGEIKRMYARPGSGAGAFLLAELERQAVLLGYATLCLSTRCVNQRALAFYRKRGYANIPSYGHYALRSESICLGKVLIETP